jgi:hypothetical protein
VMMHPLRDSVFEGLLASLPSEASLPPDDAYRGSIRTEARPQLQVALSRFVCGSADSLRAIPYNCRRRRQSCRLLTIQDNANHLPATRENLGISLGWPLINRLFATLEEDGIPRRHRGRIRLLALSAPELHTCGCYGAVPDAYELHSGPIKGENLTVTLVTDT